MYKLTIIAGMIAAIFAHSELALAADNTAATGDSTSGNAALPEVVVSDTSAADGLPAPMAGGQVAKGSKVGVLGNKDVMDTPFNTVSYTSQLILDQQARTISDVLANNPSVRSIYTDNDMTSDFLVRGNKVAALDIGYDGLYGIGYVGLDSIERVEFLTGANALLNGLGPNGGAGGMVNLVPKKAGDEPLTRITANYVSAAQLGGQLDVSRRFGENKQFGIRFNASYLNGPTDTQSQSKTVQSAVVGLDYRGSGVRVTTNFGYRYNDTDSPSRTIFVGSATVLPAPPSDPSKSWQQPWTYDISETKFATARVEYDIAPDIVAYAALGGSTFKEREFFANTQFTGNTGAIALNIVNWPVYRNTVSAETGVRGMFVAGPVKNNWSLSASAVRVTNGIVATNAVAGQLNNMYNPVYYAPPNISSLAGPSSIPKTGATTLSGVALADTLGFLNDRIQWTVGVREQNVNAKSYSVTGVESLPKSDKSAVTYATGLVFKAMENMSVYGNYIEGLQAGAVAPAGTTNVGQTFSAYVSKQYELGLKYDFGGFLTTASVYQLTTPNSVTSAAKVFSVDGEIRTRGLELNTFGEVAKGVRLLGGMALTDSVQTKTADGINNGKKATGASDVTANLGVEWDPSILQGLTLTGRAIYTSSQYADYANKLSIPSWTRYDIGARYKTSVSSHPTTFRFSVQNLFNKSYWSQAYQTYLIQGTGRIFMVSASVDM